MKRLFWHLAFWLIYLTQDVLLIFFSNSARLQARSHYDITSALATCFVLLLPKLAFSYFMLYIAVPAISQRKTLAQGVILSFLALLASLVFYRALVLFVVNPYVYHWPKDHDHFFYLLAFFVALMDVGFASGYAIALKQIKTLILTKEAEKNLMREKLEAEIKYLRYQTHPHFLFNTLNNIYGLARKKSDQTAEIVMKLSKLLRFMLYESSKPLISLGEEIKMLEDYIELESLRYNHRLQVRFHKVLDDERQSISPLLLLPFVENAFKHGASESRFESYINIQLVQNRGALTFRVENSKEQCGERGSGDQIGLANVKRQLELLYPGHQLNIHSEPALYVVELTIRLVS